MTELEKMVCVPCRGGEPPLGAEEIGRLAAEVPGWTPMEVEGVWHLQRVFKFKDFVKAMEFTRRAGELAEAQGHHPALLTEWGRVTVTWWTHKIRGLHNNDFIMSAKTSRLYEEMQPAG
jgi:4a-hydroxytetrahydrobiopterin dehydratase